MQRRKRRDRTIIMLCCSSGERWGFFKMKNKLIEVKEMRSKHGGSHGEGTRGLPLGIKLLPHCRVSLCSIIQAVRGL